MAEPTASPAPPDRLPALPSTADAAPYVPVAWLAVAAAGVAAAFVLVLLVAGLTAQRENRPLLLPQVLILPVVGLVLSFAARRVVRNAEGTRTGALFGLDLIAAAWWTSLVVGLCYLAYLFAVDFSIRQEATAEVDKFTSAVLADDLTQAFYRTRNPDERKSIDKGDTAALEARYRTEFLAFRQCDVVRVVTRNPGRCEFLPGGLRLWSPSPVGVECVYAGVLRCPEGLFPVHVPLRGAEGGTGGVAGEATGGRKWQVFHNPSGYVQRDQQKLTPYGWRVSDLERQAAVFAREFVTASRDRLARPYVFLNYARVPPESLKGEDAPLLQLTPGGMFARTVSGGVPTGFGALSVPAGLRWVPGPDIYLAVARKMYRLPGGGEPPADKANLFGASWGLLGIEAAGTRLKDSPDVHDLMTITDTAVEVRSPLEIPLANARGDKAARGRVVVRCTDPGLLAELKSLRESADPDRGTVPSPPPGKPQSYTWTVVRIESDLREVAVKQPEGPGAPSQRPGHE